MAPSHQVARKRLTMLMAGVRDQSKQLIQRFNCAVTGVAPEWPAAEEARKAGAEGAMKPAGAGLVVIGKPVKEVLSSMPSRIKRVGNGPVTQGNSPTRQFYFVWQITTLILRRKG